MGPGETEPTEDDDDSDSAPPPTNPLLGAFFHITDVQFSTVAILDGVGKLKERTRYQAYGQGLQRWPGDFNRDGYVDSTDWNELKNAQGAVIGDSAYEPDLDLNRDGALNTDDTALYNLWSGKGPLAAGQISDPVGPDNRIGYAGYVFNPRVVIYTVRNRHYEPMLGRFMEADPAGYIDGMNRYEYVGSDPIDRLDEEGLSWGGPIAEWLSKAPGIGTKSGLFGGRGFRGALNKGPFRIGWSWNPKAASQLFSIHGGAPGTAGHWHTYLNRFGLTHGSPTAGGRALLYAARGGLVVIVAATAFTVGYLISEHTGLGEAIKDHILAPIGIGVAKSEFESIQTARTCAFLKTSHSQYKDDAIKSCNIEQAWKERGCPGSIDDN